MFWTKFIIFLTSLTKCPALEFPMSIMTPPSFGVILYSSLSSLFFHSYCTSDFSMPIATGRAGVMCLASTHHVGGPGSRPNEGSLVVDIIPTIFCAKKWDQNPGNEAKVGQFAKLEVLGHNYKQRERNQWRGRDWLMMEMKKNSDGWSRVLGEATKGVTIWLFGSGLTLKIGILRRRRYTYALPILGAQNDIERS